MGRDAVRRIAGAVFLAIIAGLFYLSMTRFASQLVISTDESSLWINDLESRSGSSPRTLRLLATLDPYSADYPYLLAKKRMPTDLPQARTALAGALQNSPADPKLWVLSAWMEGRAGHFEQAMKNFDKAILLDPSRPDSYAEQGVFIADMLPHLDPGKKLLHLSLAEENILVAAKLDRRILTEPHVALALALIHRQKGENTQALRTLRNITGIDELDLHSLMRKWSLQFDLGDSRGPANDWRRLFTPGSGIATDIALLEKEIRNQSAPDFRYFLAQVLKYRGDKEGAMKELTTLTTLRPHVPDYHLALALLYEETGNRPAALKTYEHVLELSPSNEEAKRKVIEYYRSSGSSYKAVKRES